MEAQRPPPLRDRRCAPGTSHTAPPTTHCPPRRWGSKLGGSQWTKGAKSEHGRVGPRAHLATGLGGQQAGVGSGHEWNSDLTGGCRTKEGRVSPLGSCSAPAAPLPVGARPPSPGRASPHPPRGWGTMGTAGYWGREWEGWRAVDDTHQLHPRLCHLQASLRTGDRVLGAGAPGQPLGVATGLTTALLFQEKGTTWLHLWGAEECRGQ